MAHVGIMSHEDPDPTVWGTGTKAVLSVGVYWRHRAGKECLLTRRAAVTDYAYPQVHVCRAGRWGSNHRQIFLSPMGRSNGKNSDPVRGRSVAN